MIRSLSYVVGACLIALVASVWAPALADSGHRICGYSMEVKDANGVVVKYIGIMGSHDQKKDVTEATRTCDFLQKQIGKGGDPAWASFRRKDCYALAAMFPVGGNNDLCTDLPGMNKMAVSNHIGAVIHIYKYTYDVSTRTTTREAMN